MLATFFMLSVIPCQTKAATNARTDEAVTVSNETLIATHQLNEIKPIDLTLLSSANNKEFLKETSLAENEQGRHNGRYNKRRHRDVDLTIQADRGFGHRHSGAYIGGGSLLLLILILVLVL